MRHRRFTSLAVLLLASIPAFTARGQCKPVVITPGCFLNDQKTAWKEDKATTVTAPDGVRKVEILKSASGDETLKVTLGSTSKGFPAAVGRSWKYRFIGSENHLLALLVAPITPTKYEYSVLVIDFTSGTPRSELIGTSDLVPHVHPSPGTGSAFFLTNFASFPLNTIRSSGIFRSDTGAALCPGPAYTLSSTESLPLANFGDGMLRFTKNTSCAAGFFGGCILRKGSPATVTFSPAAVIGHPPQTRTVTLSNNGKDCLNITAIPAAGPFRVTTAMPIPIGSGFTSSPLTIEFAPTSKGSFSETLNVMGIGGEILSTISVSGSARDAAPKLNLTAARPFKTRFTDDSPDDVVFTASSTGDGGLRIDSITLSPADPHFELLGATTGGTAPKTFTVRFHPLSTPKTSMTTLTVKATSTLTPTPPKASVESSLVLTATTLERRADIACIADGQDFGDFTVGGDHELPVAFENRGTGFFTLTSTPVVREKNGSFVFEMKTAPTGGTVFGPGASGIAKVRFVAAAFGPGLYVGEVTISSNDPDEPLKTCTFYAEAVGTPPPPRPIRCGEIGQPACVPALSDGVLLLLAAILAGAGAFLLSRR